MKVKKWFQVRALKDRKRRLTFCPRAARRRPEGKKETRLSRRRDRILETFEEWDTQDQIALAWLLNSVSDSIVTITSKLTTSASVWSFLTNAYAAYSIAPLGTNYRVAFSLHHPQEPPTHFYQTISPAETTHQHPHSANKARWARRKQPKCQICLQFGHEAIHCRERYNPNFLPSSPTTALPPQQGVTAGGTWSPDATHYIINSEPQQSDVHSYSSPVIIEYQGQNYLQPDPIQGWAHGEEEAEYYSGNESEGEHYPGDETLPRGRGGS